MMQTSRASLYFAFENCNIKHTKLLLSYLPSLLQDGVNHVLYIPTYLSTSFSYTQ